MRPYTMTDNGRDQDAEGELGQLRLHRNERRFGDNSDTERNALDLGQRRNAHAIHSGYGFRHCRADRLHLAYGGATPTIWTGKLGVNELRCPSPTRQ